VVYNDLTTSGLTWTELQVFETREIDSQTGNSIHPTSILFDVLTDRAN